MLYILSQDCLYLDQAFDSMTVLGKGVAYSHDLDVDHRCRLLDVQPCFRAALPLSFSPSPKESLGSDREKGPVRVLGVAGPFSTVIHQLTEVTVCSRLSVQTEKTTQQSNI